MVSTDHTAHKWNMLFNELCIKAVCVCVWCVWLSERERRKNGQFSKMWTTGGYAWFIERWKTKQAAYERIYRMPFDLPYTACGLNRPWESICRKAFLSYTNINNNAGSFCFPEARIYIHIYAKQLSTTWSDSETLFCCFLLQALNRCRQSN